MVQPTSIGTSELHVFGCPGRTGINDGAGRARSWITVTPRVSAALSFKGGVHIGAKALRVLNLIWFGWIAPIPFKWFLPAFSRVEKEGGGSAPCGMALAFGLIGPFCGSAAGQSVAYAAKAMCFLVDRGKKCLQYLTWRTKYTEFLSPLEIVKGKENITYRRKSRNICVIKVPCQRNLRQLSACGVHSLPRLIIYFLAQAYEYRFTTTHGVSKYCSPRSSITSLPCKLKSCI